MDNKVIITAAVTGSIHIPTQSEYLPLTPDEIVEDAVKSFEAGAAVAHIHVREPESGKPTANADLFEEVLSKIKKRCNLVLLPTTGGGPNQTVAEKLIPISRLKPEMCSFDPAPFNLGLFEMGKKYVGKFKTDWEESYLNNAMNTMLMRPTFQDDIEYAKVMKEAQTKPEFEIYELGHIGYVTWLMDQGLIDAPPHLQFVFGPLPGWMPPSVKHLLWLHEEAVARLGEGNFTWSVAGAGRHQLPLAAAAMAMGAPNVRVGLEDSLYAGKGKMATSSADQVKMAVKLAEGLGMSAATPDDAREFFKIKGIDKVNF